MNARWYTIRVIIFSVVSTVLAEILLLYALGRILHQMTIREDTKRAEIYRAASIRLGMPETSLAKQIRQYVDCERLAPGAPREMVEITLQQIGPYTLSRSDPNILSIRFEEPIWQTLFYSRDYHFDADNRLVSIRAHDGSAFPEVECPWRYLSSVEE